MVAPYVVTNIDGGQSLTLRWPVNTKHTKRNYQMKKLMSGFAAAALVFALPMAANAQEAASAESQDVCTATIAPIAASSNAAATATFTSPFGDVISIEAPEGTGLTLVTEKRAEMANEAAADEAAPMVDETENVAHFTLNAIDVEPGTYQITLKNESGESCAAELTVKGDELKSDELGEADDVKADENEDETDSDW